MDQDNVKITFRLRLLVMLLIGTAFCIKAVSALQLFAQRAKRPVLSFYKG